MIKVITVLPFNSLRLSAYAAQTVKNIPMIVNTTVTKMVTNIDLMIDSSANIFAYAFRLNPLGNNTTLLAITKDSSLIDFEKTCMNGNKHISAMIVKTTYNTMSTAKVFFLSAVQILLG